MNISLPESLRKYVDRRVASSSYGTSSEYVRDLIRKDQAHEELRKLLLEGVESPSLGRVGADYWASKRRSRK